MNSPYLHDLEPWELCIIANKIPSSPHWKDLGNQFLHFHEFQLPFEWFQERFPHCPEEELAQEMVKELARRKVKVHELANALETLMAEERPLTQYPKYPARSGYCSTPGQRGVETICATSCLLYHIRTKS